MRGEQTTLSAFDGPSSNGAPSDEDRAEPPVNEADFEELVALIDRFGAVVEQLAERVESPESVDRSATPEPEHVDWGVR